MEKEQFPLVITHYAAVFFLHTGHLKKTVVFLEMSLISNLYKFQYKLAEEVMQMENGGCDLEGLI